ncbi:hypothetical protein HD554DRAFT_2168831 [Boletus coccyginus]|nr:hypothetical protein HD554DRAFT_2168831 [Boletus coccyginus]
MAVRATATLVTPPPWIPWPGCMASSRITPTLTLASWIPALLVSTIFFVMTLRVILSDRTLSLQDILRSSPRTEVFFYDGITCYFLTFATVLASTVVLTVVQNQLSVLPVLLLVATYSYCASRLIFNIREIDVGLRPAVVPDDPDSLPPSPFLTSPEPDEQPVASSSRV